MSTPLLWYHRQLRMVQTVLREIDAVDYDAEAVVEYCRAARANCLIVNGGGIVDFFPNPLPLANPNRFMGGRDILGDSVAASRAAGIRVVARVDFRGVDKARYDAHPDWFAVGPDGGPMVSSYTGLPLYLPCYNCRYTTEHADSFVRHILSSYDIDGIWHNCIGIWGRCCCERCRDRYRTDEGREFPPHGEVAEEELEHYARWKARCARDYMNRVRAVVKSFGEDKAYAAELFGMYDTHRPRGTGLDLSSARDSFDYLVSVSFLTDNAANARYERLGYASSIVKYMKAVAPDKQSVLLFGTNGTSHRYVMDPPVDLRVWMWEAVSAGGSFWNCLFNGQHPAATHDRRNAWLARDIYAYLADHEEILSGQMPLTDIGVFYSKATREKFGSDDPERDRYSSFVRGFETVLQDCHIQYGFCCDDSFGPQALERIKVLALPNTACLSDEHCDYIREWVKAGGTLVATFETSLHDEKGNRRDSFALADLFGCDPAGTAVDTRFDCYQLIREPGNAVLAGISDTELLMAEGETLLCSTRSGSQHTVVCTLVPRIANQPPEMAWTESMVSAYPTTVVTRFGRGTAVYFAGQPDRLSETRGHSDFRVPLAGAVGLGLGDRATVHTMAPSSVHVTVSRAPTRPGEYLVSLVNLTSGPERPLRGLLPVFDILMTVRVPGSRLIDFDVLRQDARVSIERSECRSSGTAAARVGVERLDEFASVVLRFE